MRFPDNFRRRIPPQIAAWSTGRTHPCTHAMFVEEETRKKNTNLEYSRKCFIFMISWFHWANKLHLSDFSPSTTILVMHSLKVIKMHFSDSNSPVDVLHRFKRFSRKILAIAGSNFDVWDILWKLFSMILFKKPAKQPPSWAELKAGFKQVEVVVSTISYFLLDSQAG